MIRSSSGGKRERKQQDQGYRNEKEDQQDLSDDDNAAPDIQSEVEESAENPLLLALDDLEGRVVSAVDDVKTHSGVRSSAELTVHQELAGLLRPVLEVAAHTGPSVARTYYSTTLTGEGIEASCEEVWERLVSDLSLPVLLEMAQSETVPAKVSCALEFFHAFWAEIHKAGSWLDDTVPPSPSAGPYGPGGNVSSSQQPLLNTPMMRTILERRKTKRLAHEALILRYWVQASIACTQPGKFTSSTSEDAVAARGVIAASASFRPSLRHISQRIRDADDRGAARLYKPVMEMVKGVLRKLLVVSGSEQIGEALRSACIKFVEIVALSCSHKGEQQQRRGRAVQSNKGFSLEDLPTGHPIITREALEMIAEYSFATMRGLVIMGGQVKIADILPSTSAEPSSQVVAILKPAALAYLEIESRSDTNDLEAKVDRSQVEYDFFLSQKSYALAINAVAMLATNRPPFYKEAMTCIARRAVDPPTEDATISSSAAKALRAQLKASCLTLLRNSLSVTTRSHPILSEALGKFEMTIQAEKAFKMAKQTADLKTAGRAARNRAAMFYEWEGADSSARKRHADEDLAKLRAMKKARGLGQGIQLPTNMVDAMELILLNLSNIPSKRPQTGAPKNSRKLPMTFDSLVDAVMTNGASLVHDEGQWYERDGGNSWVVNWNATEESPFALDQKLHVAAQSEFDKSKVSQLDVNAAKLPEVFQSQCRMATSQAFERILEASKTTKDVNAIEFNNQIAARLAWTMKAVKPGPDLKPALAMSTASVEAAKKREFVSRSDLGDFMDQFPLVSACLSADLVASTSQVPGNVSKSLVNCVLNESYMISCKTQNGSNEWDAELYNKALDTLIAATVHSGELADEKPNDLDRKRAAAFGTSSLTQQVTALPKISSSSLRLMCGLCDISAITSKAQDASRKNSQQTIAASASINAARQAAEKRATAVLVTLRDAAFQRSKEDIRQTAVECGVSIAAASIPSNHAIEDKALKLVMNVFYAKSDKMARLVLDAASTELERAAEYAREHYDDIQEANKEAAEENKRSNPMAPASDTEKAILEKMKKPVILFMALCARKPEMIKAMMRTCSQKRVDVLVKAVREHMPKLARALANKHGAATIALEVASMASRDEIPLVLAFLESLAPMGEKSLPSDELIEACHKIQELKLTKEGKKDPRFVIPVVAGMKRVDLVKELPGFVQAEDRVFMAALVRMGERVGRHALLFRDEPDENNPVLQGMTHTEQLVFLHKMDFMSVGMPQRRYLGAIRLCLDEDEVFTDSIVMAAMDYLSGTFLTTEADLPLAFMRTIMLTCSKHESLHSWICHKLLPRLVEGQVYKDRRQWEGWMRCARMLEKPGASGVSSRDAIATLPPDQLEAYRAKYPEN